MPSSTFAAIAARDRNAEAATRVRERLAALRMQDQREEANRLRRQGVVQSDQRMTRTERGVTTHPGLLFLNSESTLVTMRSSFAGPAPSSWRERLDRRSRERHNLSRPLPYEPETPEDVELLRLRSEALVRNKSLTTGTDETTGDDRRMASGKRKSRRQG